MAPGITLEVAFVCLAACLPFSSVSTDSPKRCPQPCLGSRENKQDALPYGVSRSQAWRQVSGVSIVGGIIVSLSRDP